MTDIIKDLKRLFIGNDVPSDYQNPNTNFKVHSVVKPITEEEVIQVVNYANEHNLVIITRGGNTGVAGSQTPFLGNEIIMDLSLMNKVIELDKETMTLTVEPGITIETVQKYALDNGLMYAPDPASKQSTIGGNVSTNAGGMRAVKYGTTRQSIRGLDVVLMNGTKLVLGSKNIKDSSGYNLKDLFIGSEGTLGIITKVMLKLVPKPLYNVTTLLAFDDEVIATETVINILAKGHIPTALEFFDKESMGYSEKLLNKKFISQKGNAYLLVTVDGNDLNTLNTTINQIHAISSRAVEKLILTDEEAVDAWVMRDYILYGLYATTKFEMLDEVVPINQFAEIIKYTKTLEKKYNIKVLNFGHSGDGNVHTIMIRDNYTDETWPAVRQGFLDDLYQEIYRLGGLISAEHGIGVYKQEHFLKNTPKANLDAMRAIKQALDPKNLLNPGKVF